MSKVKQGLTKVGDALSGNKVFRDTQAALDAHQQELQRISDRMDQQATTGGSGKLTSAKFFEPSAQTAAKQAGVEYKGLQEIPGKPDLDTFIFQDPDSGTSFAVSADKWTPEAFKEALASARARLAGTKQ